MDKLRKAVVNTRLEATLTPETFSATLRQICNRSMPKATGNLKRAPVYWWNGEIAELRKDCLTLRRQHMRSINKATVEAQRDKWDSYLTSKKALRNAIKAAKRQCWKQLCEDVDQDIWGNGYRIVMKGMTGFPPNICLSMEQTEKVAKSLFPIHEPVTFQCQDHPSFEEFTEQELEEANARVKSNKAPGPGKIPPSILKYLAHERPQYVLSAYNALAKAGKFPACWKRALLSLIRKGDKPVEKPSSYRPICLLDAEGKLYEQLLVGRLKKELVRSGDLSNQQYGFRKGRQTVDAIQEVINVAKMAAAYATRNRKICAVITIDVRNAFNSACWQLILAELRKRNIDEGLVKIIASYLSERTIVLSADGQTVEREINSGVPQGSVMGPTLWNILYDGLLEAEQPEGVQLIGFADDIAMTIIAPDEETLMWKANTALLKVANLLERKKLQLAPEKTEAVVLTSKRKLSEIQFEIDGVMINPRESIRYLGVWLDKRLSFNAHVEKVAQKAERTAAALSRIMPNIGGPRAAKRRAIACVVHSQILYASPIWSVATKCQSIKAEADE